MFFYSLFPFSSSICITQCSKYEGVKIPSLVEFLDLCKGIDLIPYIELKTGNRHQIEQVVGIIHQYKLAGEPVFVSSSLALLGYVLDFDPDANIGYFVSSFDEKLIDTVNQFNMTDKFFISSRDYSKSAASLCQSFGVPFEV